MSDVITDLFGNSITDGFRKFLAHFAIKMIDEARFIQMFIDAGKHISGYEYYKNEENNFRAQVFSEESMRSLARMMRSIDDYSWMDALEQQLDVMLEGLEENNRQNCKRIPGYRIGISIIHHRRTNLQLRSTACGQAERASIFRNISHPGVCLRFAHRKHRKHQCHTQHQRYLSHLSHFIFSFHLQKTIVKTAIPAFPV